MTEGKDEDYEANRTDNQPEIQGSSGLGIPISAEEPTHKNAQLNAPINSPETAQSVRRELHLLEILNFIGQIVLAIVGIFAAYIYGRQLHVMQGQLDEMKRSGEQSTEQMWSAIGNVNWMARSMDWSQKVAKQGIEASSAQAQQSLQATQDETYLNQRPWVGIKIQISKIPESKSAQPTERDSSFEVIAYNSGRTPALHFTQTCIYDSFITKSAPDDVKTKLPEDCQEALHMQFEARMQKKIDQRRSSIPPTSQDAWEKSFRTSQECFWEQQERQQKLAPHLSGITIVPGEPYSLHSAFGPSENNWIWHYWFGTFIYRDPLRPNIEHTTNWCVMRFQEQNWELCNFGQSMS